MPTVTAPPTTQSGLTALIAGIVASLPNKRVRAPSGAWHWAFKRLRDEYTDQLPEFRQLEFVTRPGVWPVSERLERILQIIDMAGSGSTLNPTLLVREFSKAQKGRLSKRVRPRLAARQALVEQLGKELRDLLKRAPASPAT